MKDLLFAWYYSLETRSALWLILILLFSLFLRVTEATFADIPESQDHRFKIAQNLSEGRGYIGCGYIPFCQPEDNQTAIAGPIPVLVFAAMISVFDDRAESAIFTLHTLIGIVNTGLLYLIVLQLFRCRTAALIGAFLFATYRPLIFLELTMEADTIFVLLLLLSFIAMINAIESKRLLYWFLAGSGLALAGQCRDAFVYFPIILTLVIPFIAGGILRQKIAQAAIFFFAFSIFLSPWIVRNAMVFDGFIPGSTLTGYNLYRHNHQIAENDYLRYVGSGEGKIIVAKLLEKRTDLRGDENEFEMDHVFRTEAIDIITNYPDRYFHLSLYRSLNLWMGRGIYDGSIRLAGITNLILLVLAIVTSVRRGFTYNPIVTIILLLIAYYTVGHMLVNAQMRFIAPIIPLVIVLAADQLYFIATHMINLLDRREES